MWGIRYSHRVCVLYVDVYARNICIESICIPQFELRRMRQDAVGIHLCCCVLWLTLSNWWRPVFVCVCVCVCVCVLSCNTGPSQHVWPCSCSRANFSPGCAYASVPLAWPMRDEERMREKEWPIFHSLFLSSILCTYLSLFLSFSIITCSIYFSCQKRLVFFVSTSMCPRGSTIDSHRNTLTVVTARLWPLLTKSQFTPHWGIYLFASLSFLLHMVIFLHRKPGNSVHLPVLYLL